MQPFHGLGMGLGQLSRLSRAKTRSISAENWTGEKGKGGMATEGTGKAASRDLGQGWKVSPSVHIPANSTFTLADIGAAGAIQHIWLTCFPTLWRTLIIRMYWDGEEQPSVEVPIGDFFCNGWCERTNVNSLPVAVNPAGGMNCYWEMPFRKSARITVENLADKDAVLYFQIDYTLTEVPEDAAYFHARWRRSNPLPYKEVHTLLDGVTGHGHYVGTYLAWQSNNSGWFGEGEIKFYMDGDDEFPTLCGTGTEDYFGGAWNWEHPKGERIRHVLHSFPRHASGIEAGRAVPQPAAVRHVQVARHGPDSLRDRLARYDPGAGLAFRRAVLAAAGRHRLDGVLVPVGAARALRPAARDRRTRGDLGSVARHLLLPR
jgi:hypothetical protein